MSNKLGISDERLNIIEKELIHMKLSFLDECFTFNKQELNFNFLKSLNDFLFCDFYYEKDLGTRKLNSDEIQLINVYMDKICNMCVSNTLDINKVLELICLIWEMQPFNTGNTRTLLGYLKIINAGYLLGLDININENIESNPNIFKKITSVNQKRLTKIK